MDFLEVHQHVIQRWRNYANSKVLHSIRSQEESSSKTRTLFWNYQVEYKNYKMKQIVWTILRTSRMLNQLAVEIPTLPFDQCLSQHIRYLKGCWDLPSYRRAAKKGRHAFGHTWYIGKRFCKSTCFLFSSLSSRIESMGDNHWGAAPYVHSGEKWKTRTKSRSEMPVWTVSQRFSHLQWRRLFKELWGTPTTTADFWLSLIHIWRCRRRG